MGLLLREARPSRTPACSTGVPRASDMLASTWKFAENAATRKHGGQRGTRAGGHQRLWRAARIPLEDITGARSGKLVSEQRMIVGAVLWMAG